MGGGASELDHLFEQCIFLIGTGLSHLLLSLVGETTEKGPVAKAIGCKRSGNENREEACVLFHNIDANISGTVLARGDTAATYLVDDAHSPSGDKNLPLHS